MTLALSEASPELSRQVMVECLREFPEVRLTVTGDCMAPAMRAGDIVTLVAVARRRPRLGDVVLAAWDAGGPRRGDVLIPAAVKFEEDFRAVGARDDHPLVLLGARKLEHRSGFPDFMDLLVVCADSGLAMEASLERVGRELGQTYPSLSANIHLTNLEIRAGRPLKEALEHFADRLALEESRAFATLINQSIDLGSSITDAMRVYSDDMRHKRLSTAEEKAYALPAKLAVPMMVCIFPVLFVVILLPVIVKLHTGGYF